MKKLLLLGLTLLLMAALLMGCDKGNTPDDTTDPSAATEDATAAPTEPDGDATEKMTQRVMHNGTAYSRKKKSVFQEARTWRL